MIFEKKKKGTKGGCRLIGVLLAVLVGINAHADVERDLMNLGLPGPLAEIIAAGRFDSIILSNATTKTTGILTGASSLSSDVSTAIVNNFVVDPTSSVGANILSNGANVGGESLLFMKTRSTSTDANTVVQSGDTIANISFYGADGATYKNAAQIRATVDGTPGSSDMPGALSIWTTPDGAATPELVVKFGQDKSLATYGQITSAYTGALGWTLVSVANQACNTTCTSACIMGQETTSKAFLACTDATADICLCAGAS